ncbi:hypothetical protein roselon_03392 [Roseibacterium elongatum DSM 19469]|uniref:Uncharacterized protein n=1 Tax=Roseicyclus elongatus DSM 19469 TaxID=1294273 RepID=W8SSZ8_9RHOB|nr:hypothetical protein [Roseibacterium elongatum]AHM05650.1 hypothetical protein roselon_03392 [Roseibacterium elongatum DSM 19469]
MRDSQQLPESVTLPMPFSVFIHPNPDSSRGAAITGHGAITLGFGPAREDGEIDVRIEDIQLSLNPCSIPFDLDGDGQLECIELPYLRIGPEFFDLEASHGRFNPDTGAFSLTTVVQFDDAILGEAARAPGQKLRIDVVEHGYLHLETGRFDTKANPVSIEDGPLKGLTIFNCEGEVTQSRCFASLDFGARVISPHMPTKTSVLGAENKIVKARDSAVRLVWEGKPAQQVEVRPGVGKRYHTDYQDFPDVTKGLRTIDATDTFAARTVDLGECVPAEKTVDIIVVGRGEVLNQSVPFDDFYKSWYVVLPPDVYDPALMIGEIMIDGTRPGSVTHQRWHLYHIGIGTSGSSGTTFSSFNDWRPTGAAQTLPGTYRFTPAGTFPTSDYQKTLFFQLKVL